MRLPARLKAFVDGEAWTFAKTNADTWPHEYLVRARVDKDLFVQLVRHIRAHGYEGRFYDQTYTYDLAGNMSAKTGKGVDEFYDLLIEEAG